MKKALLLLVILLASCGGGGGGGATPASAPASTIPSVTVAPGSNVLSLYAAPASVNVNVLLTSITICTPNSSNCTVIPNILVDTGSYGIRLLKSAIPASIPLTQLNGSGGGPLFECTQFASGYTWGSVQVADVKMAGETAYGLPVQVVDDISTVQNPAVPASCTGVSIGNAAALNANGILGIGVFSYECGQYCATSANNGVFFECPSACSSLAEPLNLQPQNPVSRFSLDNNGVVIVLPQLAAAGASGLTGSLIFGIGTRSNNAPGSATVVPLDASGNFTTVFNNQTISSSFIDTGSNMYFFQDGATPLCKYVIQGYCPSSTQQLSATVQGTATGTPAITVNFSVGNADALVSTGNAVFNNIAGTTITPSSFDWGLPFLFGRTVYFAINGSMTPAGSGPFVAF